MRNVFDQYSQPENRLTHALMSCLYEDRILLAKFIGWVMDGQSDVSGRRLTVTEQSLPGEEEATDAYDAERRGLPDGCIYDENGWALLIEAKIAAALTTDQLLRHLRTAERHGLKDVTLLTLIADRTKSPQLPRVNARKWTELYLWLKRHSDVHVWAARLTDYMEILEARLVEEGYLREGTLTVFTGIPFGPESPYSYLEAKRVLLLAMDELRKRSDLAKELGIDQAAPGRPAITGSSASRVWDFIPLTRAHGANNFTEFPHLTMGIHQEYLNVIVSIPNGIRREFRRNLLDGGFGEFRAVFSSILSQLGGVLENTKGVIPWIEALQRHYPSQRSEPIIDAMLTFDLRTAFDEYDGSDHVVKMQPQWLEATYDALSNRKSNIHLGVGARFSYAGCPVVNSPEILNLIAQTWIACKPLIEKMIK